MNTLELTMLGAGAFSCALLTFNSVAEQRGWPTGQLFASQKAGTVGLICGVLLLLCGAYHVYIGTGWWPLGLLIGGWIIGGPTVSLLAGRFSGPASLVLAPVLTAVTTFSAPL